MDDYEMLKDLQNTLEGIQKQYAEEFARMLAAFPEVRRLEKQIEEIRAEIAILDKRLREAAIAHYKATGEKEYQGYRVRLMKRITSVDENAVIEIAREMEHDPRYQGLIKISVARSEVSKLAEQGLLPEGVVVMEYVPEVYTK